jgi:hypothetical protein
MWKRSVCFSLWDKHYGSAVCYGLLCINGHVGVNLEQAGNVDKHDAY